LEFPKIENLLGDGSCSYYAILSKYFFNRYEGDTLGADINNEKIMYATKYEVYYLKEKIVKPY
jgi:hypothetical protein